MEQALFRLHVRTVTLSRRLLSRRAQQLLEYAVLLFAVATAITLYSVHKAYVSSTGSTCLVEALAKDRIINDYQLLKISIYDEAQPFNKLVERLTSPPSFAAEAATRSCEEHPLLSSSAKRLYLFSLDKGYLMLSSNAMKSHNIRTREVSLSCADGCFGSPFYGLLLYYVVGYDTVVKNWVMKYFGGKGYLYNIVSEELFDLSIAADFVKKTGNAGSTGIVQGDAGDGIWAYIDSLNHYIAFKVGVMLTTLFLFFTTTTLVSFTLRITQERMIRFTFLLQQAISRRLPIATLIITHVIETLVFVPLYLGTTFFMYEFFLDHMLAFLVIGVVWLAEIFSLMSLRTLVSIRYFPRLFFFYFSMFNIYFFSFPYGFSYLALVCTVLFLVHSMLFLMHRYEFPALESGLVTALCPRATSSAPHAAAPRPAQSLPREALDASLLFAAGDGAPAAADSLPPAHPPPRSSPFRHSAHANFGGGRARRLSRMAASNPPLHPNPNPRAAGLTAAFPEVSTLDRHRSSISLPLSPSRHPQYLEVLGSNPLRESTSSSFFDHLVDVDDDAVLASSAAAVPASPGGRFVEECSRHMQLSRQIQQQEMETLSTWFGFETQDNNLTS